MVYAERRKYDVLEGLALDQQEPVRKKARLCGVRSGVGPEINHTLLSQYFTKVLTLRDYILLKLPATSKVRRKKLATTGLERLPIVETLGIEETISELLDSTIVGLTEQSEHASDNRWEQWTSFTQRGDVSSATLSDGLAGAAFSQSEIVDFVIWQLWSRIKTSAPASRPQHVLCDGYRKGSNFTRYQTQAGDRICNIPGIYSVWPNPQVEAIKQDPWPQLLKLLGKCGDRIMMDLLFDCAMFTSLQNGQGNYRQISGRPLNDMKPITQSTLPKNWHGNEKSPSEIIFVRNRMLYARAALNARGQVHFGLRHIHILNRAPYAHTEAQSNTQTSGDDPIVVKNRANTRRVMMYMFPKQFGLHNVFASRIDFMQTAQRLQDYTLREQEISKKIAKGEINLENRLPKRLRGSAQVLVQRLQVLHGKCSYSKLLQNYCPINGSCELNGSSQSIRNKSNNAVESSLAKETQTLRKESSYSVPLKPGQLSSITSVATQAAKVSAFCQAVILKIVPLDFFGSDGAQKHNQNMLLKRIDQFIRLRRFESMSLHEVMQGMKITNIGWLGPTKLKSHKTSKSDIEKRTEIFYEFLYYIFDSLLIPLLRSNFYITESSTAKYQLFFFRHDVWRYVAEPAMSSLKVRMFEEVHLNDAKRILDSRELGFSHVRLLPKGTSVRPIMNLRKRMIKKGNRLELGKSINTLLKPIHTILQLEKILNPNKLGAAMSSVGDMYQRIKYFRSRVDMHSSQFYFAKVDVQSAFDTIPQSAIVDLLNSVPQRPEYQIAKHVEISNGSSAGLKDHLPQGKGRKPLHKWLSTATEHKNLSSLLRFIESDRALKKRNTVFIESVIKQNYNTSSMLQLVASHIQENLVKIGKKYYRQKEGIPQGSVLSSTLCNYFYADLEAHVLKFLDSDDCLLLRLIDDFLLISTDRVKASRFVAAMHDGVPEYGVTVNTGKTLVNFDVVVGEMVVPRTAARSTGFPYCGTLIDTSTLNITKDRHDRSTTGGAFDQVVTISKESLFDSLTVEYTRIPGQTFMRKVFNAFKIQSHLMYFDTSFNSAPTMLWNFYSALVETAIKTWAYIRCLPLTKRPSAQLIIRTIENLVDIAFLLATSKTRKARYPGYVCDIRKIEVNWLVYSAFADVLGRKQSNYTDVLKWLKDEIRRMASTEVIRKGRVSHVVSTLG